MDQHPTHIETLKAIFHIKTSRQIWCEKQTDMEKQCINCNL